MRGQWFLFLSLPFYPVSSQRGYDSVISVFSESSTGPATEGYWINTSWVNKTTNLICMWPLGNSLSSQVSLMQNEARLDVPVRSFLAPAHLWMLYLGLWRNQRSFFYTKPQSHRQKWLQWINVCSLAKLLSFNSSMGFGWSVLTLTQTICQSSGFPESQAMGGEIILALRCRPR